MSAQVAALFVRANSHCMGRAEREATPPVFARWLVELARSCAGVAA